MTSRAVPKVLELGAVDAATATVAVDPHDFLLAATGRLDAAPLGLDPTVDLYAE